MSPNDISIISVKMEHLNEKMDEVKDMIVHHMGDEEHKLDKIVTNQKEQHESLVKYMKENFSEKWVERVITFLLATGVTVMIGVLYELLKR